jgi:hypothetical protein
MVPSSLSLILHRCPLSLPVSLCTPVVAHHRQPCHHRRDNVTRTIEVTFGLRSVAQLLLTLALYWYELAWNGTLSEPDPLMLILRPTSGASCV